MTKCRNIVRSTTSISVLANAAPMQRRVPPPNGTQAKVGGLVPTKRYGSKRSGSAKIVGVLVQVGDAHHDVVAVRDAPFADFELRRGDVAAGEVDHRSGPLHLEDRGLPELAAALVDLLDQLGEDVGMAAQPLERPAQRRRGGLVSRAEQRQQFVGDVLPRHRASVFVSAAQHQRQNVGALVEIRVRLGLVDQRVDGAVEVAAELRQPPHGLWRPGLNGGSGSAAMRDPSFTYGGTISRR